MYSSSNESKREHEAFFTAIKWFGEVVGDLYDNFQFLFDFHFFLQDHVGKALHRSLVDHTKSQFNANKAEKFHFKEDKKTSNLNNFKRNVTTKNLPDNTEERTSIRSLR